MLKNKIDLIIHDCLENSTALITEIFEYQPPVFYKWEGTHTPDNKIIYYDKYPKEERPIREKAKFTCRLKLNNKIRLSKESNGIYLLRNHKAFYVGKTDARIEQRMHAHITKITATHTRHSHGKEWQKFARSRYEELKENSLKIDDFKITFFDYYKFKNLIHMTIDSEYLDEQETLIYFNILNKFL
jgi:GIY-YIG catalytic domain.